MEASRLSYRPRYLLAEDDRGPLVGIVADARPSFGRSRLLDTVLQRLTLVVSQHQLETALAYATRIVGLRRGRVCFDGAPRDVTPAVVDAIYGDGG